MFIAAFEATELTTGASVRATVTEQMKCLCGSTNWKVIPEIHDANGDMDEMHLHFECDNCHAEYCSGVEVLLVEDDTTEDRQAS